MVESRKKKIFRNVAPAILSNACVFLFSVVDGIFVGNGAGSQALGAVNIALPFVLIAQALNAMASIGGVTITAIRFGRGDKEGAQNAFMHSFTLNLIVGILITLSGSVFTGAVCGLLGASESYYSLVTEYVFWYALFAIPNALSLNLQSFCRNDNSPGLVAVTNVVSNRPVFHACNHALHELYSYGHIRRHRYKLLCDNLLPVLVYNGGVLWHLRGDCADNRR